VSIVDDRLPDWLHGVSLDPAGDDLGTHRRVVESIAGATALDRVVSLVSYAHGLEGDDEGVAFAQVRDAARATEPSWVSEPGGVLSRRLAAAALAQLMTEYKSSVSAAAALATSSATLIGATPNVPELPALAEQALAALADDARAVPESPTTSFRARVDAEFKQLPAKSAEGATATPVMSDQLRAYMIEMRSACRTIADDADAYLRTLARHAQRTSEELDLLWWAMEPQTEFVSEAWKQSGLKAVTVVALEVARRLAVDPPSRGTRGIIYRALKAADVDPLAPRSLSEVIDAAPDDTLTGSVTHDRAVCWARPVLSALRERQALKTSAWHDSFEIKTDIAVETTASTADWSLRAVRDFSLDRLVGR
jgi:hypothetical protein